MKSCLLAAVTALLLAGCSSGPTQTAGTASPAAAPVQTAYEPGTIKKGDKGHCVVCFVKEGNPGEETVAETLDYKGKTYVFCNEKEKAEFISDPGKFATR